MQFEILLDVTKEKLGAFPESLIGTINAVILDRNKGTSTEFG
jgi:hypothetical protein